MERGPKRLKREEAINLFKQVVEDYFTFGRLNKDLLLQIMFNSGLSMNDILNLCLAAPSFERFCQKDEIWDDIFQQHFRGKFEESQTLWRGMYEDQMDWLDNEEDRKEILGKMEKLRNLPDMYFLQWKSWRRKHRNGPAALMAWLYLWELKKEYDENVVWGDSPEPNLWLDFEAPDGKTIVRVFQYHPDFISGRIYIHLYQPEDPDSSPMEEKVLKDFVNSNGLQIIARHSYETYYSNRYVGYNVEEFDISYYGFEIRRSINLLYTLLIKGWKLRPADRKQFPTHIHAFCINCNFMGLQASMVACGGPCRGRLALYCNQECANAHFAVHRKVCTFKKK